MKNPLFPILFFLLLLTACKGDEMAEAQTTESLLLGLWGDYEGEQANTNDAIFNTDYVFNLYCDGFELKENGDYTVFYQRGFNASALNTRVDGTWSLENDNKLIIYFGPNNTQAHLEAEILAISENELVLKYEDSGGDQIEVHLRKL